VHDALGKDSGQTTTLKLMQIMFEKGLAVRNERYRSHHYEPPAPKDQTHRQIAGDLVKRAFEVSRRAWCWERSPRSRLQARIWPG